MSIAPDFRSLKRRLDRFVWENASTEAVMLRRVLEEHFDRFESVGIIGGLVRDLARGGRSAFKSDLDLVIDAGRDEVSALAHQVGARGNRFGGFGFTAGPWKIDFWALENTWAVTQGHVAVSGLRDVVRCTFFDCDSIVYDLRYKRILCDEAYLDRLRTRRIEIILRSNPGELGNLLRASRRIVKWGVHPGPQLRLFIDERLDHDAFLTIRQAERTKHADWILGEFKNAEELRGRLLSSRQPSRDMLQMELPLERHVAAAPDV